MNDARQPTEAEGSLNPGTGDTGAEVDPWLLSILACPVDHASVRVDGTHLVCDQCGRRYPVRDGIPVMIPADAEKRT